MFFVASTGRSGTQTIAKTFSKMPGCICLHEPSPELILESSSYRYGDVSHEQIKKILIKTRQSELNGKIYGESNQTLSLIIPVLTDVFPEAKFLWLIRNGLDVVSSIVARKWYTGHTYKHDKYEDCAPIEKLWIDGRIEGDRCGDVPKKQWDAMNPFARCCWYWSYINRIIETDLQKYVGIGRYRTVYLEQFQSEFLEVTKWLGLSVANTSPVGCYNKATYTNYTWEQWSGPERKTFLYWCGHLMDRLYPEWQNKTKGFLRCDSSICCGSHDTLTDKTKSHSNVEDQAPDDLLSSEKRIHFTPQFSIIPRISVYITSFNQKKYLLEAIESVLAQTLRPHQIIIVDDFSSDGSQELIAEYAKQFPDLITTIYHNKNVGISRSRIDALYAVTGDYVTYVDGDDRFLPKKLEKEFDLLMGNPQAQIAFSNNYYMTEEGVRTDVWSKSSLPPQGDIFCQTFARGFPRKNLYRMELVNYQAWKAIGFHDPKITIYEDFDMRIRMTKYLKAVYFNEALSEIRFHNQGLSKLPLSQHLASLDYIYQKNRHLLHDLNPTDRNYIEDNFKNWIANISDKATRNISDHKTKTDAFMAPPLKIRSNNTADSFGSNLIFILSQPRAGSTLLQRILGGHPKIHTTAEPWIMLHPLYALKKKGINAEYDATLAREALKDFLLQAPENEALYTTAIRRMANTLYNRMLELSGKSYFLDKTPRYFYIVPELFRVFPKAKYIVLFRNPLAVLSSILKSWFDNSIEKLMKKPNYLDVIHGPHYLIEGINCLTEQAIVVHYERLVLNPEEVLKHICSRIGIPYDKKMLNYSKSPVPNWRFGDTQRVHAHSRPVLDYYEKWPGHLSSPKLNKFALDHLSTLGPEIISRMGYSYQEIKDKLMKTPKKDLIEAEILNQKGEKLFKNNDTEGALHVFTEVVDKYPDFGPSHNNLGVMLWKLGKTEKGVQHFKRALQINPNDYYTVLNYGTALTMIDKVQDAIEIYKTFLKNNPYNGEIGHVLSSLQNKNPKNALISRTDGKGYNYLVSAIVSTYNSEKFIRGRLEDLEAQTIADQLEIIVVDSGSEQNEAEIVKKFQQKHSNIQYIRTKERESLYAAWNRGIKAAHGKYITNANTDDRLNIYALEKMVNSLNEMPHVGIIYIDQIKTNKPNETFDNHQACGFFRRDDYSKELIVKKNPCGPQVIWRRELHDMIGYFRNDYEVAGDWEFWLRTVFYTKFSIYHIPELLGLYYVNQQGLELGNRKQKERLNEINKIRQTYEKLYLQSHNPNNKNNKDSTIKNIVSEASSRQPQLSYKPLQNKKNNILLTTSAAPDQAPFSTKEKRAPLGIGFLISVLRNAGHRIFFIDNYLQPSNFLETDYLQKNNIDYVGIYANTICFRDTLRILYRLEYLRQTSKWNGKVIVGGPHASVSLDTIPSFVDFIVQGEGEQAILDIVEGKISHRVVKYPRINNLDTLPMPAWDYFVKLPYDWKMEFFPEAPVFTMNTSRGCSFECTFCSVSSIWGKRYTYFSAERIISEIEHLIIHYDAKGIYFREDNFTLNKKRLKRFCNLLIEKNIKIAWACESRVSSIDREMLELMTRSGLCGFYFGVESGSQKMLDFLSKGITVEQIRNAFGLCHEFGIKTAASILFGIPEETEDDIKKTFKLLQEINPTVVWNNIFVGIPNSKLYRYCINNKLYEFIDDRGLVYLKGHNARTKKFYSGTWNADIPFDKTNLPKVSVVMSVYNASKYLSEAINSILCQSYHDYEFIIIDDASNDNSAEIIKSYTDPRIRLIKNRENIGLTKSLNKAIREARGIYIARMDADDISLPHRLEVQVSFLEKNPECVLVGSAYYRIDPQGNVYKLSQLLTEPNDIKEGLKIKNWFAHGSVMMRKEAFLETGGYDEKYIYAQDYDLWIRLSEKYSLANLAEPVYCWRTTHGCVSFSRKEEQQYYAALARKSAAQKRKQNACHKSPPKVDYEKPGQIQNLLKGSSITQDANRLYTEALQALNQGILDTAVAQFDYILENIDPLHFQTICVLRELENVLGKQWLQKRERYFINKYGNNVSKNAYLLAAQFNNSATIMKHLYENLIHSQNSKTQIEDDDLISVIVPCHNEEKNVQRTIQSIFNQTYMNYEIIIVDDGSDDNTCAIIENIRETHPQHTIKLIRQDNKGLSAARNTGAKNTQGKYLVFLDGNDEILPDFLWDLYATMQKNYNYGWTYPVTLQYGIINRLWSFIEFNPLVLASQNLHPVTCLIKKEVFERVGGFDENMRDGYEDWNFWLNAVRIGQGGKLCKKILFTYHKRENSMLQKQRAAEREFLAKIQLINNNRPCYVLIGDKEKEILKNSLRIDHSLVNKNYFINKKQTATIIKPNETVSITKQSRCKNNLSVNKLKILFYFFKNVHVPILIPIYKKVKQLHPEAEIAFGYMPYAPQIRAGFASEELKTLECYGEKMFSVPQEFNPDISFIADSVYPWTQSCGKLVNVGHGVLSKGQYYTHTETARREEQADLVCVPGIYHEKIMKQIISKPVVSTGMAKMDGLFSGSINRASVTRQFGLPQNQYQYILFAPTFNDELSSIPFVMDQVNEVIPDDKTFLLIKLHGSTKQEYKEMYLKLVKKDPRIIFADELDITPFLPLADVMISDVSSAMMEFAALDKPLILFNNPNWTSYQNYNPSDIEFQWRDIGTQVRNVAEMKKAVQQGFLHPEEHAHKRKFYTDQLFANKYDGKAAERIIKNAFALLD